MQLQYVKLFNKVNKHALQTLPKSSAQKLANSPFYGQKINLLMKTYHTDK